MVKLNTKLQVDIPFGLEGKAKTGCGGEEGKLSVHLNIVVNISRTNADLGVWSYAVQGAIFKVNDGTLGGTEAGLDLCANYVGGITIGGVFVLKLCVIRVNTHADIIFQPGFIIQASHEVNISVIRMINIDVILGVAAAKTQADSLFKGEHGRGEGHQCKGY
ncbi:MAG TPA: hypothetical protein PLX72_06210 [Candidatus Syntrophosphaera sp.]|nr:hypothetical protein [Candidatus Syntrophosphaera sp.]